jgi:hypothetical protein
MMPRSLAIVLGVVFVVIVAAGALYEWLVPGLSSARQEPGPVETNVATWLLHRSVPAEAKARSTRWQTIHPRLRPVTTCSARNVSPATDTTAVGKPRSAPDNIRDRRR